MKKLFISALLFLSGIAASVAQTKTNESMIPEYLDRHWQFSLHSGYDFGMNHNDSYRRLKFKGGPSFGIGFDHYWKWFGIGVDGNYIINKSDFTYSSKEIENFDFRRIVKNTKNINRLFVGVGPSFRLPSKCCPPFMAELNLRAGIANISGSKSSFGGYYNSSITSEENITKVYEAEKIDVTRLALKAQIRLSYFFNEWFGLNAGAYYMHCFNVPYADAEFRPVIIKAPQAIHKATQQYDNTGKTEMSSIGVFGGLIFRICAKKKPTPVVIPEPKPTPVPTEFMLKGRVTICGTTQAAVGATVKVLNTKTKKERKFTTDSRGEYSVSLKADTRYTINISMKECLPSEEHVIEAGQYDPVKTTLVTVEQCLTKPKVNVPIRLNNIHYDFDKANIRPDARPELNRLVTYLKENPTIRVEMSSHTDSRGSDEYNRKLSQRRANSVKAYLVEHGIDDSRIVSVGYGESRLLNKCSNNVPCSEEEHQLNRRTEMKVIE